MKITFRLVLAVAILGYVAVSNIFGVDLANKGARTSNGVDRTDACFMSQKFVKENLKSPTSAQFPSWTVENCNAIRTGNTWKVRSFVDSENSFGATIRSDYGVEMRYSADNDTWTLIDIAIVGR